jgi:hypothetical protein
LDAKTLGRGREREGGREGGRERERERETHTQTQKRVSGFDKRRWQSCVCAMGSDKHGLARHVIIAHDQALLHHWLSANGTGRRRRPWHVKRKNNYDTVPSVRT